MTPIGSAPATNLARITTAEFVVYVRHLATRVERAARSVTAEQLWARPFPFGNSIGHLVLHLTGNLNHYIGALVAGTGYVRDRPREFSEPAHSSVDELLERFRKAVDMVVRTLEAHDDESLCLPVAEEPPIQTRLGLFLVCAAHMNNHIGQMSYMVQAFETSTKEPAVW
jgi:uncharacterized damage-inducible protein DinB